MKRTSRKSKILIANIVVLLGLSGLNVYQFMQNRDLKGQVNLTTEEKNKRIISEINKVFDLPDEEPVVAIVTDPVEFKKQYASFDNAESGDYLLFFRKARLNVLYRQSQKKVVKTASVTVPITVELVGSESATNEAANKLKDFGNQITIVKTVKDGITQSFVFDVDNDQKEETASIAKQLGLDVGSTLTSSITPGQQTEVVVSVSSSSSSAPVQP